MKRFITQTCPKCTKFGNTMITDTVTKMGHCAACGYEISQRMPSPPKLDLVNITATTLSDAWYQVLYTCVEHGRKFKVDSGSYAGQERLELDYFTVLIQKPDIEPLLPIMPEGSNIPAPFDDDFLNRYEAYLRTAGLKENESYTYGSRLVRAEVASIFVNADLFDKIVRRDTLCEEWILDQIEGMITLYKNIGPPYRTNQMVLQIAQPSDLLLDDPPCLRHIDTRIQDGRLDFFVYFRSWDIFGGFPLNLAVIERLKQYMAESIGVDNGVIVAASKGAHIYDHCWEMAETLRGKKINGGN